MPRPNISPEESYPSVPDDDGTPTRVDRPVTRADAHAQPLHDAYDEVPDFHRPSGLGRVRAGGMPTRTTHAEASAAAKEPTVDANGEPSVTSAETPEKTTVSDRSITMAATLFKRAAAGGVSMTAAQAIRAAQIATGDRVVSPGSLPFRLRVQPTLSQLAARYGVSVPGPAAVDAADTPLTPSDDTSEHTNNMAPDPVEPQVGSGGSGRLPPTDTPPTDFAELPEDSDNDPNREPAPENGPTQAHAREVSPAALALIREAAALGVGISLQDAERTLSTIRPAEEGSRTERGEQLAVAAAEWGVHMSRTDIEAATDTVYVEDRGPQPLNRSDYEVPPAPLARNVEALPGTIPLEPYVLPEGGTANVSPLYEAALDRLREDGPYVPPEIAAAQSAVVTTATHKLGAITASEGRLVIDLLPASARALPELAPFIVDSAVSNPGLALKAQELGVAVSPTEIRLRLLTAIGENLPPGVEYIKPEVPHVTEGLLVTSRLEEYRRLTGQSMATVAEVSGLDPRTLERIFQGETYPWLRTLQRVMQGLGVPEDVAIPLLRTYQWESAQRHAR